MAAKVAETRNGKLQVRILPAHLFNERINMEENKIDENVSAFIQNALSSCHTSVMQLVIKEMKKDNSKNDK